MSDDPLKDVSFTQIARSNKMVLLKLMYKTLLYRGLDFNDENNVIENAITSVIYDTAKDRFEIAKFLIENKANIFPGDLIMAIRAYDQSDLYTDESVKVSVKDAAMDTYESEKVKPSLGLVLLLINGVPKVGVRGADVTEKDKDGESILVKALQTDYYDTNEKENERASLRIVKELVKYGADVTQDVLDIAEQRAPQSVVDYLTEEF